MVLKATGASVRFHELPPEVLRTASSKVLSSSVASKASPAEELTSLMLDRGESFWAAVYPLFMSRDLTRADLRRIVQAGLERTNGNYRSLVQLFNMPVADYRRFLSFLRKHDCHLPFQRFRTIAARLPPADAPPLASSSGTKASAFPPAFGEPPAKQAI
jgi:hypothetical protein